MAAYCYLYWDEEGHLACKVNHNKYWVCDLYREEDEIELI